MIIFKRNGEGYIDAYSDSKIYVDFALWLSDDIQSSLEWADEVISHVDRIRNGDIAEWERVGNAWILKLDSNVAFIESLLNDDEGDKVESESPSRMSFPDFSCLIKSWKSFLVNEECKKMAIFLPD